MLTESLGVLRRLLQSQFLSEEELHARQSCRLRDVVRLAYDKVGYYGALFRREGIRPEDIRDANDVSRLPITTKKDFQSRPQADFVVSGIRPEECVAKRTSGSTGQPLTFLFTPAERDFQTLMNLRILFANGFRLTDRMAYLINPHRFPKGKYWFQNLGILRRYYLSVFDDPEVHRDAILAIRPDILYGYPSNLTMLGLLFREKGMGGYRPKAVYSSAETLEEGPRALISRTMGTDVYDILGLVETGDIAWECHAHEGYHLNTDAVMMEFLDDADRPVPPGRPGRLVCTSLYARTMPLIRYDTGDICVPVSRRCSCGRTLPLMESITGRANDFIVLPDGKIIASCFLVIIMQGFPEVAQYRILQNDRDVLHLQIVRGNRFGPETSGRIEKEIRGVAGPEIGIRMEFMEALERDDSGKIRTVVSKVIPDFPEKLKTSFDVGRWAGDR